MVVVDVRLLKDKSRASSIKALMGIEERHTTVMMNFSRSRTVSLHSF